MQNIATQPYTSNPSVVPAHEHYLTERGVPLSIAVAAGLQSMSADDLSSLLGFTPSGGGLAIPYPGITPPYVRVRLDEGDAKFMAPSNRCVPVYLPPGFPAQSSEPFIITEGPIKTLSLMAGGFASVALGGVSTTLTEEHELNESWQSLRLSERDVFVAFDTNRYKAPIALAEARLCAALSAKGANVRIIRLPRPEVGDWGPDDLKVMHGPSAIAACCLGAGVADPAKFAGECITAHGDGAISVLLDDDAWLIALQHWPRGLRQAVKTMFKKFGAAKDLERALIDARRKVREGASANAKETPSKYVMEGGQTRVIGEESDTLLARFEARIVREIVVDDGVEVARKFVLSGMTERATALPNVQIDPATFHSASWPTQNWGSKAIVSAGRGVFDHLRAAIQEVSDPEIVQVFGHTGWRQLPDGNWAFLHSEGAIGGDAHVDLGEDLARYALPSANGSPYDAFRCAVQLLEVAPLRITAPMFLAVFRAPLMHFLPMDAALHLFGSTGSMKSSLAALFASFYGGFEYNSLPASFIDTFGALERKCNVLHDVVLVVDEYVPQSVDHTDEMRKTATKFYRYLGNRSPRNRLRADLSARKPRPPNALVITTGEDLPTGESIIARMLAIEVTQDDVKLDLLTAAQQKSSALPHAMSAYIAWLRERIGVVELGLRAEFNELRTELAQSGSHRRCPSTGAHLALALKLIAQFAVDRCALSPTYAEEIVERLRHGLMLALDAQTHLSVGENPGRRFLEVLVSMLATGVVRINNRSEVEVDDGPPIVGYRSGNKVFLIKDVVSKEVMEFVRKQGGRIASGMGEILRSLSDQGLMTPGDGQHHLPKRTIGDRTLRVIEIDASLLKGEGNAASEEVENGDGVPYRLEPPDEDEFGPRHGVALAKVAG